MCSSSQSSQICNGGARLDLTLGYGQLGQSIFNHHNTYKSLKYLKFFIDSYLFLAQAIF
jgi:hypothetical protein